MPSPVAHSLVGVAAWIALSRTGRVAAGVRSLAVCVVCANLPDLDFVPGILVGDCNRFHHGYTHSIGFALVASLLGVVAWESAVAGGRQRGALLRYGWTFALVASHLFLDFLGEDPIPPQGQPLFWPLTGQLVYVDRVTVFPNLAKESWGAVCSMQNVKAFLVEMAFTGPLVLAVCMLAPRPRESSR